MRFLIRYSFSLIRSRRRIQFLLSISLLIFIVFIFFFINQKRQTKKISNEKFQSATNIIKTISQKNNWPLDENDRSLKTKFLVLDWTGFFGSSGNEGEQVECSSSNSIFIWTRQHSRINEIDFVIAHDASAGESIPFKNLQLNQDKQQYSMAFVIESEVHSSTGDNWAKFHFKMTYHLDNSYPEPATYFDNNPYIIDLLSPPLVTFENKEKHADVVWIISNCNAHNGRQDFIQRLMQEIKVDSYGPCLHNRNGYGQRMTDNVAAYKKYKFVIAIENSNCADYVTEKLVKTVAAGSVPIVAGREGRPDYRRYMPKHSFINIFDYSSIKEFANDIKRIGNNRTLYESYLWYKNHDKNLTKLKDLSLNEKIKQLADVIGSNATMITDGIIGKEKSENKICKLIRFVRQTPWKTINEHKKTSRDDSAIACLPGRNILKFFESVQTNHSKS